MRLFLGPLRAWVKALPDSAAGNLPAAVRLILISFLDGVTEAYQVPVPFLGAPEREAFCTDAKAQGEDVASAGRETLHSANPKDGRWFAVRSTRKNAYWVFAGPASRIR